MQSQLRKCLLGLTVAAGWSLPFAAGPAGATEPVPPVQFPGGFAPPPPPAGAPVPPPPPPGVLPAAPPGQAAGPVEGHTEKHDEAGHGEHKTHVADLTPEFLDHMPEHGHAGHDFHATHMAPRFWGFGEYLLLRPRIDGLDYAVTDPSNNATPQGHVERVNYDTSSGLRVGLGFRPGDSPLDFSFTYTFLHAEGSQSATAPGGGTLYALLGRPGVVDNVGTALGTAALDYHIYDILAGRTMCVDPMLDIRLDGGVRLANIRTDFNGAYDSLPGMAAIGFSDNADANAALVQTSTRFTGAGLTVGGQGDIKCGYGLSVFGRARGSLLYGDVKNRLLATNNAGATVDADLTDSGTRIVPVAELGAGLSWQFRQRLLVSAGYEVTNWFGLIDRPLFTDDFAEGRFERRISPLSLEGIFVRLGLAF